MLAKALTESVCVCVGERGGVVRASMRLLQDKPLTHRARLAGVEREGREAERAREGDSVRLRERELATDRGQGSAHVC